MQRCSDLGSFSAALTFFFVLPPLLLLFCIFRSLFYFVACSVQFAAHDFLFFANVVYSAPGWSSGYRLQSEANPAFKQSRRNSGFICHQRTSKGLTKSKLPRLPEDVRVGTGAVVAHGWTTAKFPHANESPSPCPRVRALACWLPCGLVGLLSLSVSRHFLPLALFPLLRAWASP